MFKNIFGHVAALWRRIEQIGAEERTVLAVTAFSPLQMELRIMAIQESWRILFATSLTTALQVSKVHKVNVVIYDRDLCGLDWRESLRSFVGGEEPVFFILLSTSIDQRLWKVVLESGGYDVARRQVERSRLAPLVNGAFALASSIDLGRRRLLMDPN